MDLKLTEQVRNIISLLYKQKTGWNSDIWNFFSKKKKKKKTPNKQTNKQTILACISLKIDIFRSTMLYYVIVTSYVDRFSRGATTLYYRAKQLYFERVNFKFTGGGNHPPKGDVLQKRPMTRVNIRI